MKRKLQNLARIEKYARKIGKFRKFVIKKGIKSGKFHVEGSIFGPKGARKKLGLKTYPGAEAAIV